MNARNIVLEPRLYHASFLNSFLSEIRKIAYLRSFWIQTAVLVVLYSAIMFAIGVSQKEYGGGSMLDAQVVTTGVSFLVIFSFALGASAVTNEYSSNTMRTTALADPSRLRSYSAKHLAVFVMVGAVNLVLTLLAALVYGISAGGSWDLGNGNFRALAVFWVILTTAATMATSIGYILRSTAGTITLAMALVYVSNAVALVNIDWIRDTLYHYLPLQIIQDATATELGSSLMGEGLSWGTATIAWLCYALVFWVLGLLRFQRSDI